MKQLPTFHCDACGLPVDPQTMEECPRCHYPVNPAKEEHFLESAIGDLQRVATFGGANLRVVDLIRRYQARLDTLRLLKAVPAPVVAPVPAMYEGAESIPAQSFGPSMQQVQAEEPLESLAPAPPLSPQAVQVSAAPLPGGEQAARRVFSWRSFFADQTINIVASLGAFLILVGSLSFTATTSSLLLSFLVVFLVHAVFGITGFITQRFPNFRVVATIYTVIFALLVPLVGFSAYRLFTGNNSGFSVPALVAITAVYAAIMYTVLAIYQRFIPFAYLGMVALVVADLAVAAAFQLAYWWWPSMAIVLAFPALVAVQRLAGNNWPFAGSWAVLRDPVRLVMYALVSACGLAFLVAPSYSLLLDAFGAPVRELRFALLSLSLLVLLWMGLFLWITRRGRAALVLAYLFLVSVLLFCYALDFEAIGYALALAAVALVYHGLNRFAGRLLQPFGVLSLGLDQLALALVLLEPFISSPLLPLRLFARAYAISLVPFQTGWHTFAELGAVGLGLAITVSVILNRAGAGKTPAKPAWCWLLLLSGFLLNWEYGILVLVLDIEPVWAFLGLGLLMVAVAVLARQLVGAAWANPLDVLALAGSALTLGLSLHQSQDVIGALLLSFAALAYVVLLYQRRQNWLFLPLIGYSLLAFTAAALVIMLVERVPELLLFPAGLAAWAIWQWRPPLDLVALLTSSPRLKAGDSQPHGWELPASSRRALTGLARPGLTISPQANTASPAALLFSAALMSRSWVTPHSGQDHTRTSSERESRICPQS